MINIFKYFENKNTFILIKYIFAGTILFYLFFNLKIEYRLLIAPPHSTDSSVYPGSSFLVLKPYLQGVPIAGYWTDYKSSSPETDGNFVFPYLRALFALSPTILDFRNPFSHELIVFVSTNDEAKQKQLKLIHAHTVFAFDIPHSPLGISLIRRSRK